LTQLIAFTGRRIDQLQQTGADADELAALRARRAEWVQRRLDLAPTDTTAVQHVLAADAEMLRMFQNGAR
jgi:hypothetical protein